MIPKSTQKRKIEPGLQFGRWTVVRLAPRIEGKNKHCICVCSCGTRRSIECSNLNRGLSESCGCYQKEVVSNIWKTKKEKGLKVSTNNKTYRYWVRLIEYARENKVKVCKRWLNYFNFYSDMGVRLINHRIVRLDKNLELGPNNCVWEKISSRERHGMSDSKIHRIWLKLRSTAAMCGYEFAERWHSFMAFLEDMGSPPDGMRSIERVNKNGAFDRNNCIWVSRNARHMPRLA